MYHIALSMLFGNSGRYYAIVFGIGFSSLIMTQQPAIFLGLMERSYALVEDINQPDVWVMDKKTQQVDDIEPLYEMDLYRVRGVEGIEWAVPLRKSDIRAKLSDGSFQNVTVIGIDDASFIGAPTLMTSGTADSLRHPSTVLVDEYGANTKLRNPRDNRATSIGDTLVLGNLTASVTGTMIIHQTFQAQPVIYTSYSHAREFDGQSPKGLSFILVKAASGTTPEELAKRINENTDLAAYTRDGFKKLNYDYIMKHTSIPLNFGISVALGILVGAAIAGQTFYTFTIENLRYYGLLKAIGVRDNKILKMVLLQGITVGFVGFGLGSGITAMMGLLARGSVISFKLTPAIFFYSGAGILAICMTTAYLSVRRILLLDPAVSFRS
jgi:putative ABC transport system permease protein